MSDEWSQGAVDFLQAIADTKLILSHRYAEWMLSGPALEDDIAGSSATQDEIGHVRQLFDKLGKQGRDKAWLQGDRDPAEFNNAASIDDELDTWPRFVTAMDLTERAAWYLIDSIAHEDFDGLGTRIGQDEYFHLDHLDSRLRYCAAENPAEVEAALTAFVPDVLAFIGPAAYDAESDPLLESGFTDRSAAAIRTGFESHYRSLFEETGVDVSVVDWDGPSIEEWDETRRRIGDRHVAPTVVELLQGVENAEYART